MTAPVAGVNFLEMDGVSAEKSVTKTTTFVKRTCNTHCPLSKVEFVHEKEFFLFYFFQLS